VAFDFALAFPSPPRHNAAMWQERTYYVYIMASRTHVLYIGITGDIEVRAKQHREHQYKGFTDDYNCERLVYFERFGDPNTAIARETQLKKWRREKKLALITKQNPTWQDLSEVWRTPIELYQWPERNAKPTATAKAKAATGSSTTPSR
jgi:putative endonuclease